MPSKKLSSADNQQERLIKIGWIIGFVDGEGCFSISFIKQPSKVESKRIRKGYKTGYQVTHEFAVTQGAKSVTSLYEFQSFFGIGQVLINKRHDNHKEHLFRYVVRKRKDLLEVIIPFFRKYKLHTSKQQDFERFSQCVEMIEQGYNLTKVGLIKIAKISQTMNRQKSRKELIRILRDHMPDTQVCGEDMVPTAWRHAGGDDLSPPPNKISWVRFKRNSLSGKEHLPLAGEIP